MAIHILVTRYPIERHSDEEMNAHQIHFIDRITGSIIREKPAQKVLINIQDKEKLSYNAKIIMQDLKKFPFDFQSEREVRLNINARIISENLEELEINGWLRRYENKISLGKGKGQFRLFLFTDKAINEFKRQDIRGKGSIEHVFWQARCAKHFSEKGYNVEIEYFPSEKNNVDEKETSLNSIDIIAYNNHERIAIEIELNDVPQNKKNIQKCIKQGFDKIIIAVYRSKLMQRIQRIILTDIEMEKWLKKGKIEIRLLSQFV